MLPSRSVIRREQKNATYVCLSCRRNHQRPPSARLAARRVDEQEPAEASSGRTLNAARQPPQRPEPTKQTSTTATHASNQLQQPTWTQRTTESASQRKNVLSAVPTSHESLHMFSDSSTRSRRYHTSHQRRQQATLAEQPPDAPPPGTSGSFGHSGLRIREQLRQWQETHGQDLESRYKTVEHGSNIDMGETANVLTRFPESSFSWDQARKEAEEQEAMAHFSTSSEEGSAQHTNFFLKPGDLIELEFPHSERESIIAVFVRRQLAGCQIFTMQGRWVYVPEVAILYSIPGWISPSAVEPLISYLPDVNSPDEMEDLMQRAYMEDLSVPRDISARLVRRMVQFYEESQEIYRKHASSLDAAHATLAHETDLKYGSLVSAAASLLKIPPAKLPVTALFTVRQALSRAGFAFNVDKRSHRLTGHLQIRSKEQCRTVETVRDYFREWQEDRALRAAMEGNEKRLQRHRPKQGAEIINSFVEKARAIVLKSRENRMPTICGGVGPSKKRFAITPDSNAVWIELDNSFTKHDEEIIRFMEAWSCSLMLQGLVRLEALPPLLLQATGLYANYDLNARTGYLFLQEMGTVMPYENRVKFDQNLMLPASQLSKPLQDLMSTLLQMKDRHNFQDSMADLRHDFGDLPVFCIDGAAAHEIDDGLSVEDAGAGQWWVHIHVANPTAFFSRDHPLAKMARHMGESIYMPDRTYMMLPPWATQQHFSLDNNRPSLTFSVKMDQEGRTLEHKVRPGFVRNVLRLTHADLDTVLGIEKSDDGEQEIVLTVGGDPPPPKTRQSSLSRITPAMVEQLKVLRHLGDKRTHIRTEAGGVFFDLHRPEVEVFTSSKGPGLAWDPPYRKGSRTTYGDPVIRLTTKNLYNWFARIEQPSNVLVREMMLLACETAAKWCDERKVPIIYRGSIATPDQPNPDEYLRDVLAPAAAQAPNGEYPMHLGVRYLHSLGRTVLTSKPLLHRTLGMSHYTKVTSPLRRYGDMIVHWQIEAVLREEARRGHSLVTTEPKPDLAFLPFNTNVLNGIMLGLQPRERTILRARDFAERFWTNQLLFRAFHFGESTLPLPQSNELIESAAAHKQNLHENLEAPMPPQGHTCKVYVQSATVLHSMSCGVQNVELNVSCSMHPPEKFGLGRAQQGDVWECLVSHVDIYHRTTWVKPLRLLERVDD